MADPPVLCARHAFGLKGDVSSPIHYGDEATTIYPCGHSVVLYNSEAKDQELIPGLPQTKGITALALAPSRKWLCVAERGLETAQIGVYDVIQQQQHPPPLSQKTMPIREDWTSSECPEDWTPCPSSPWKKAWRASQPVMHTKTRSWRK